MPPNPRDGHRLRNGKVPITGLADVIADSLRPAYPIEPGTRDRLAALVVERLSFFELLADDVDTSHCDGDVHVTPHRGCILR
jgi:hypothetical protein